MFKRKHKIIVVSLTAVLSFFMLSISQIHATNFTVVTNDAAVPVNGDGCTLREAITNINDGAQTHSDCPAGDGVDDTINLPGANSTVVLLDDLPTITTSMTIQGEGMGQSTIDGVGQWSIFTNSAASSTNLLTIEGVTLSAFNSYGFYSFNGNVALNNLEADCTGSNFDTSPNALQGAIGFSNGFDGQNATFDATNIYVHDCVYNDVNLLFGIGIFSAPFSDPGIPGDVIANLSNVTVESFSGSVTTAAIVITAGMQGGANGDINAELSNITINNIVSSGANAVGIINFTLAQNVGNLTSDVFVNNSTFQNLTGQPSLFDGGSVAIASASAAGNQAVSATANTNVRNALIADINDSCFAGDISSVLGGLGTGISSLVSQGGNITDNNACSSFFTQLTDQNNLTNLASTLGTLSDNGGFVPTIPLLESSPAIDAGVIVAGLSTDARQAIRPQGLAFDSGAYESPFTRPVTSTASLADTGESSAALLAVSVALLVSGVFLMKQKICYNAK